MRFPFVCLLLVRAVTGVALADYLEDTGYYRLAAALGPGLPDGSGMVVTQVEFGDPDYLPEGGSGTFAGSSPLFAGKIFRAAGGTSAASGHAYDVGGHFYGLNRQPALGRAGFTPGISQVDIYRVDGSDSASSWTAAGWLNPGLLSAPLTERAAVQNHSWISNGSSASANTDNTALRRFDFAIVRDGFLAVTGVNNGASAVPALMASAYNNISAGLSSGSHSAGGTPSWLNGPGRQKPEIVAPLDYTSFSTSLVSSAGTLLRQSAASQGTAATRPETLKAILLAGATKEEFPDWSHTPGAPLDARYGAGELHVENSWNILAGLNQSANQSAPRPDKAWARVTLTAGGTADYILTIPPGAAGASLSAVACWNRIVRDTGPGSTFLMTVDSLANYNLSLARLPAAGAPEVLEESLSTLDNLEHVYRRNLPSGTYRLRLNLVSGSNVPVSLAWRLTSSPHRPDIRISRPGTMDQLEFSNLIPGQSYLIQGSPDLAAWHPVQAFSATGGIFHWSGPVTAGRKFYRLAATD